MFRKKLLAIGAVLAGLLVPAQAMAAYEAITRVDLNLRVGPDTNYGVIDVIPYGDPVVVLGCLDGYYWCDVEWYGLRGWVAAQYLVEPGTTVYLPQLAPRIGLPILVFSFNTYHDRHYRDRPWYRERRGHWRGRDFSREWRDRAEERDRDRARYRDRDRAGNRDGDRDRVRERDRDGERAQERERAREQAKERETRRERAQRSQQRQETQKPRQRQETRKPRQRQETQKPRQRERAQRAEQRQRSERPRKRERSESRGRSRGDGDEQRKRNRGQ